MTRRKIDNGCVNGVVKVRTVFVRTMSTDGARGELASSGVEPDETADGSAPKRADGSQVCPLLHCPLPAAGFSALPSAVFGEVRTDPTGTWAGEPND